MRHKSDDEGLMTRYLLGELPEVDKAQVEERFLRDYEYFERLRAVEEELNDGYAQGELSEREREQFEQRLLASPEWRERVQFARALSLVGAGPPEAREAPAELRGESIPWWKSLSSFPGARKPAFQLSLAAVAITILVAGSWLILKTSRLRAELEQNQAQLQQIEQREQQLQQQTADERARADQLAQELERERQKREHLQTELQEPAPQRSIVSFILMPGVGRGEVEQTKLIVPRETRLMQLQLYLHGPTPYKGYRAELRAAGGKLIWSRDGLSARKTRSGKAVTLSLPVDALTSGKHEMALKGVISKEQVEDVGYYYFSIEKK